MFLMMKSISEDINAQLMIKLLSFHSITWEMGEMFKEFQKMLKHEKYYNNKYKNNILIKFLDNKFFIIFNNLYIYIWNNNQK